MTSPTPNQTTARRVNFGWENPDIVAKRKAHISIASTSVQMCRRFLEGQSFEQIAAHYRCDVDTVARSVGLRADAEYARFVR